MEREHELLSTEIVNLGIEHFGPNAGSMNFSVKVRPRLPDFSTAVNLKYVKLGYTRLLGHAFYFLFAPMLIAVCNIIGKLAWLDFYSSCDRIDVLFMLAFLGLIIYICLYLTPRSIYLVDVSCYRPPDELKISKEEFIQLAKNSGKFNDAAIKFQERALKNSGIGDESYLPRKVFSPGQKTLKDGREEVAMAIFGAVDDLLAETNIRPKDIKVLIVNCGVLNTTPSLSAMVINHYKLSHNINSYNLGGMGCAAGIIAIDVAKDLLKAYPGSYALVVSTEAVTYTWYDGDDANMLLPNCFIRTGAAAMLLSSRRLDRLRSKYELKQLVRTHKGMDNRSFKSIYLKEDEEGRQGLSVSKDIIEVGGEALEANINSLAHLVLPMFEQIRFFIDLLFEKSNTNKKKKSGVPNIMHAFEHICISATSKKVLDETHKKLHLTEEHMEASRKTLYRFGNTCSSSIWYELGFLEANKRIKKGDRIWQVAFGSGFKCNSVVWKALKNVKRPNRSPWILNSI